MAEETVIPNDDLDLSGAELSRPLLDKLVLCRVFECQTVSVEGGRKQKRIQLVTEEQTTATNGREINPGFKVTHRINLDVEGKRTQQMINEQLARFQVAALKLDKPERWGEDARYVGAQVKVKFKTRPDRQDGSILYQDLASIAKAD